MIIVNMQNKLYIIQFSHRLMTDLQPVLEQQSWNPEIMNFASFTKLPKKTKLPEKFKLPAKRGLKPMEMRKRN